MRRLFALLAALALGLVATVALSAPAQATTCWAGFCKSGFVIHVEDGGYDAPIVIRCEGSTSWDQQKLVHEGTDSDSDCTAAHHDVGWIWVRADEEIHCKTLFGWQLTFDDRGEHRLSDDFGERCVVQRD